MSPSINYKEKYILKCYECKEYYSLFEAFLNHSSIHFTTKIKDDDDNELAEHGNVIIKSEYASDVIEVVCMVIAAGRIRGGRFG